MEAIFELAHEEVAGVDGAVDSDLWVGHDNITYFGDICKLKQKWSFWRDAGLGELVVGPYFSIFEGFFLLSSEFCLIFRLLHVLFQFFWMENVGIWFICFFETCDPFIDVLYWYSFYIFEGKFLYLRLDLVKQSFKIYLFSFWFSDLPYGIQFQSLFSFLFGVR